MLLEVVCMHMNATAQHICCLTADRPQSICAASVLLVLVLARLLALHCELPSSYCAVYVLNDIHDVSLIISRNVTCWKIILNTT
jgi:hypothetical protein